MSAEKSTGDDAVLGRVTDPAALREERVGVAQLELTLPTAWTKRRVRITLPQTLRCSRCGGGGCDGCGRSGAFRLPADDEARRMELEVPIIGTKPVAVVVPRPLGDASPVRQLVCVIEGGGEPSTSVSLIDEPASPVPSPASPEPAWRWAWAAAGVAVALAIARLLAG